jgi:hydroxyacylglutathione hydrolase
MALDLLTLPCLSDNYAFLIHSAETGETALIDVPEAGPILDALKAKGWTLTDVLLTHHHWDHVDGLPDLLAALPNTPRVWGAASDAHRLPPLSNPMHEGDRATVCGEEVVVLDVSGHTIGHIAFSFPTSGLVFTGDSLMAMGCGRLFEGTPDRMWQSLSKLAALPDETLVCSGHEYTAANLRFAQTLDAANPDLILRASQIEKARADGRATVPSTLALERQTNPFLRATDPALKSALGMAGADDAAVFAAIRARKDKF